MCPIFNRICVLCLWFVLYPYPAPASTSMDVKSNASVARAPPELRTQTMHCWSTLGCSCIPLCLTICSLDNFVVLASIDIVCQTICKLDNFDFAVTNGYMWFFTLWTIAKNYCTTWPNVIAAKDGGEIQNKYPILKKMKMSLFKYLPVFETLAFSDIKIRQKLIHFRSVLIRSGGRTSS